MKKRNVIKVTVISIIAIVLSVFIVVNGQQNNQWLGSWNASETNFINMKNNGLFNYENQTLRTIVTLSYGGSTERAKFSNEYGTEELEIAAASIAIANSDGTLQENTIVELTFNGNKNVIINKGECIWSDPIYMEVNAQDKIAVSTYLPNKLMSVTGGCGNVYAYVSEQGNYISENFTDKNYEPIHYFTTL